MFDGTCDLTVMWIYPHYSEKTHTKVREPDVAQRCYDTQFTVFVSDRHEVDRMQSLQVIPDQFELARFAAVSRPRNGTKEEVA